MSRSYRKFLSWPSSEFEPVEWPGIRVKERRCIHDEFHCAEHGEVLFPAYHRTREASWSSSSRIYQSKKDIRDEYFKETRDILNSYQNWRYGREYDYDGYEFFIYDFNRIRSGVCLDGINSRFEWLNSREAKEAVKNWEGDPLDIIDHLAHSGMIERAVCRECRRMSRK